MPGKPELLRALENLKQVSAELSSKPEHGAERLRLAFDDCQKAANDIHYAHALYREIAEIALEHEYWALAELFSIQALKKCPGHGAALKILGRSLKGQGQLADAAICHRYRLPISISKKHFSDIQPRTVPAKDSAGVKILPAYPASTRLVSPPITLDNVAIWELSQNELNSAAANTHQLKNAKLWFDGFNAVVWDMHSKIVSELHRGFPAVVQEAVKDRTPTRLTGRTCLLGNRNSDNYYHWMNDILPRLHVLQSSGIKLQSVHQYVVNQLEHSFQHDTLSMLGIKSSQLFFVEDQGYFECDELLVPIYGSNSLGRAQAPWNPEFLKSTFLKYSSKEHSDKLYISRLRAKGRSISNEKALLPWLESRGFKTVYLEQLTIAEQAVLFNKANVILAPHGAGLSNTVFCKPETTVIELYHEHIAPCFWLISEMMNLRHAVIYCGMDKYPDFDFDSEEYHNSADTRRLSDFSVDLAKLERMLEYLKIV